MVAGITKGIERLLDGPIDATWPVFLHIAPIVDRFLESRGREIITIDDVFSQSGKFRRQRAREQRELAEQDVASVLDAYLAAAVPHMHAIGCAFDNYFKPDPTQQKPFDIHEATNQGMFYMILAEHLSRMMRLSCVFPSETQKDVAKVVKHFRRKKDSGFTVDDRSTHMMFKHGNLAIDSSPSYPLVAEVARIKYNTRWAKKIARVTCQGLMELQDVKEIFLATEHPKALQKEVRETFGGMNYFGLATPFGKDGLYAPFPDPMEYLFIRSRVSDAVGVFYITRTRQEVFHLLQRIIQGNFLGGGYYEILRGSVLVKDGKRWRYDHHQPVIDNHFETGSLEGTGGNKNLFFYMKPKISHPKFDIRVDFGISDLSGYVHDCPPNEGSHIIFEQRQQQKIRAWPRAYRELYDSLSNATLSIMEHLNVYKYQLIPQRIENSAQPYRQKSAPKAGATIDVS